ncbi:MAG TPA: hypothetical protein VMX58_09110 [Patescibacteria group bacterium]|nr:hypothetical protein [Patescibacteria group bacterium]
MNCRMTCARIVEGFRRDVVAVNQALLNTPWHQRYIREYHEVPLPFADAAAVRRSLESIDSDEFSGRISSGKSGWKCRKNRGTARNAACPAIRT